MSHRTLHTQQLQLSRHQVWTPHLWYLLYQSCHYQQLPGVCLNVPALLLLGSFALCSPQLLLLLQLLPAAAGLAAAPGPAQQWRCCYAMLQSQNSRTAPLPVAALLHRPHLASNHCTSPCCG
jgi:hypothetical protein